MVSLGREQTGLCWDTGLGGGSAGWGGRGRGGTVPQPWGDRGTWGTPCCSKTHRQGGETEALSGCGALDGFDGATSAG